MNEPVLYDNDMKRLAYLENARQVNYTRRYNGLWVGGFLLPASDPKAAFLQSMRFVELHDSARVELFRICNKRRVRNGGEINIYCELEHTLATLMDDILYRYHQIGGLGVNTTEVLEYILSYQAEPRWQLGAVDFARQFEYSWENENLLAALFSVPNVFDQDYRWDFSTTSLPWTISLREADNSEGPEIRAGRNMKDIEFIEDARHLTTRLYALGQGEGVNQLGIEEVNPTEEAYIDADTIDEYGIITRVWVDRRYEHPDNLFEAAKNMLNKLKRPRIEITVAAHDLKNITLVDADRFRLGRPALVKDIDLDVDYVSRVTELHKPDINGQPDAVDITIANAPKDIAGTIADLANRSRINEVYSQGATNIDSHQMADNCDPGNPMKLKFHIPTEAVFINKILLNYETEAFRAYSTGAAAGGAATTTSASGGGASTTSSSGGGTSTTTSSGGGQTSSSSGSHSHSVSGQTAWSSGAHTHPVVSNRRFTWTGGAGTASHNHQLWSDGTTIGSATSFGSHSHSVSGTTSNTTGSHSHSVSNHSHGVSISSHTHSVNIPNHSHNVDLPNHTHPIQYGIYTGPTPGSVEVKVDGNVIPGLGTSENEVNIVDYLERTPGGRIVRGWHEVEITPNSLGRVNVAVHIQQFLQSKGELRV